MLRAAFRQLLANRLRLAATALAVCLGVAFLAGTLVLTDTVTTTFDRLFASVYGGTDAVVREKATFSGPQNSGDQRGRVDESLVRSVRNVPGVDHVEGVALGYARIVDKDGDPIGDPARGAPTLGYSWSDDARLNPFNVSSGRAPTNPTEVAIDKQSAAAAAYRLGDAVTVLAQGPSRTFTLVGIVRFGDADSPAGASVAVFDSATAQTFVGEPNKWDAINVVGRNDVSQQQLVDRIAPLLPAQDEVVTGAQVVSESQSQARKAMSFFASFMLSFALVALVVGAFMIFNTFTITVAQRTRESALLRAIGASRAQVLGSVLLEALAVGLITSGLGLAVGYAFAVGLKVLLGSLGFDVPARGVVFTAGTAELAVLVGLVVTIVAAVVPARRASRTLPIEALREAGADRDATKATWRRPVVGGVLVTCGGVVLLDGLFGEPDNRLASVGLGALGVFFGVAVLGRSWSSPFSRVIGWPLARVRGISGALARQNAMRNPKRTAASASALMIGVGLVAFITIFAASSKASIDAGVDRAFVGDLIVDSSAGPAGGIDHGLATTLARQPELQAVSAIRVGAAKVFGTAEYVPAVDPGTAFSILEVGVTQGSASDLIAGTIAVQEQAAREHGLRIGDSVPITFAQTGSQRLRVALIYRERQPMGSWFISQSTYEANYANRLDFDVLVKKAPNVSQAEALAAVKAVTRNYPGVDVMDQAALKAAQAAQIDQLLALVYALLGLAIVIGVLGIGNTVALSIVERTREIGLLRAVGMTRSQLRSTIRWESVIIALEGTVQGLAIGWLFGWAVVRALHDDGITELRAPVSSLVVILVLATIAGIVAAVPPARRAAKLDALRAISSE